MIITQRHESKRGVTKGVKRNKGDLQETQMFGNYEYMDQVTSDTWLQTIIYVTMTTEDV